MTRPNNHGQREKLIDFLEDGLGRTPPLTDEELKERLTRAKVAQNRWCCQDSLDRMMDTLEKERFDTSKFGMMATFFGNSSPRMRFIMNNNILRWQEVESWAADKVEQGVQAVSDAAEYVSDAVEDGMKKAWKAAQQAVTAVEGVRHSIITKLTP